MKKHMRNLALGLVVAAGTSVAWAESEFMVYGGIQGAPHNHVTVDGVELQPSVRWEGRSFDSPPYYGLRYTQWLDSNWGWSVNFTHAKVYASEASKANLGFTTLEMTDGINPLTFNAMFRSAQPWGPLQPYAGVGAGISIPHVELQTGSNPKTFGYQYGGPVVDLLAGVKYPLNEKWSLVAEYQFHYFLLDVKMDPGSRFKSNIITNALNLGVAYNW